jgi:hypothetical protein
MYSTRQYGDSVPEALSFKRIRLQMTHSACGILRICIDNGQQ